MTGLRRCRREWALRWHFARHHRAAWKEAKRLHVPVGLLEAAHALWRVGEEDCTGYPAKIRDQPLNAVIRAAQDGHDLHVVADLIAAVTGHEGPGYAVDHLLDEFSRAVRRKGNRVDERLGPWVDLFRWDQEYVKYHQAGLGTLADTYVSARVPFEIGQHRHPSASLAAWPSLVIRCRNFTQPGMDWATLVADRAPLLRHMSPKDEHSFATVLGWADVFGTDRTIVYVRAGLTYDEASACTPEDDQALAVLAALRQDATA